MGILYKKGKTQSFQKSNKIPKKAAEKTPKETISRDWRDYSKDYNIGMRKMRTKLRAAQLKKAKKTTGTFIKNELKK
jgi:hypothetical protein